VVSDVGECPIAWVAIVIVPMHGFELGLVRSGVPYRANHCLFTLCCVKLNHRMPHAHLNTGFGVILLFWKLFIFAAVKFEATTLFS
jgi:hypothetical protein